MTPHKHIIIACSIETNLQSLVLDEKHHITRTQQGDIEAFAPLVSKYHPRLFNHINGRVTDNETAKDLTQETWMRAYRGINNFRGKSAFSSWLYRIAENVCIDHFRKQKHDTDPLHTVEEHHITRIVPCPSRDIERQELRLHLKNALECLTATRRLVFVLYYYHELPVKTIASTSKSRKALSKHTFATQDFNFKNS